MNNRLGRLILYGLVPILLAATTAGCVVDEALLDGVYGGISETVATVLSTLALRVAGIE